MGTLSEPLRIAVVGACPYPVPQGSQVYLRNTALAWREAGHEPHLVVYGYGRGDDTTGIPIHRGMNVPGARKTAAGPSWAKPLQDLFLVRELQHVVRHHRIDLIDAHNYEGLMVALAARRRPILYHAHNVLADELPYYFANPDQAATLGAWFDRTFPRRADHVIAPHETMKDYLVSVGCDPDRVSVIPPWIEAPAFDTAQPARKDVAMLYAGNLDDYQNLDLLLPVLEAVRAEEPAVQLVIATSEEHPQRRRPELADHARFVTATNFQLIRRELERDVIFVCPRTSWSGYPIKLLNAMAAGLAIVCCAGSAHPLVHQYTGLVVPDNDVEAFAQSVLRLLRDPDLRRNLGQNARTAVEEKHSVDVAAIALQHAADRVRGA